jgi:hypothetical protein
MATRICAQSHNSAERILIRITETGETRFSANDFGMLFVMRPDVYRLGCADCIDEIRCSICRVRWGVMPSNRSITVNCPR